MFRHSSAPQKKPIAPVFLVALATAWTTNAFAAAVEVSDVQEQTEPGQFFTFSFDAEDGLFTPESGAVGTVLIELENIDLSYRSAFENFTYDIESLVTGGPISGDDLDTISDTDTVRSIDGTFSFDIDHADLSQILDDMVFSMNLDFTSNVGFNDRIPRFVRVTLAYTYDAEAVVPVPVPAAAWLFGSALGLLGWLRRRPG